MKPSSTSAHPALALHGAGLTPSLTAPIDSRRPTRRVVGPTMPRPAAAWPSESPEALRRRSLEQVIDVLSPSERPVSYRARPSASCRPRESYITLARLTLERLGADDPEVRPKASPVRRRHVLTDPCRPSTWGLDRSERAPDAFESMAPIAQARTALIPGLWSSGVVPTSPPRAIQPRAKRVRLNVEVEFHDDTRFYAGITDNISEGGLFVATYEPLAIGTRIDLRFRLPGGFTSNVSGVVRWHREPLYLSSCELPPGMGIQFEDLPEADAEAIRCFIDYGGGSMFYEE